MPFRNLPSQTAAPLAELISTRSGQVSSMSFTRIGDPLAATLLAFAEGESVSEETYPGDTLYYLVEGTCEIKLPERRLHMAAGDVLMVPAGVEHAVGPTSAIKILQLTLEG